ncbi:MAG: M36 family metallopeptidase, partial [Rubricoccaceae bacterium]|nr:M36 family metallopeptidase [Rubricoccaceae bacterium]
RTAADWYRPGVVADSPGETSLPAGYLLPDLETARLVYVVTEAGPVRLAWEVLVDTRDGRHLWQARVDAERGGVLDLADLVVHDTWGSPAPAPAADLAPLASPPSSALLGGRRQGSLYNVFAMPAESPNHGPQRPAVNPSDPAASPLGWHHDGFSAFTTTRGNNVHAYEDRDANNDPGFSPDGGADLVFDFPFDPDLPPRSYLPLAVTNLFYWNNVVHDVLWHYGFDEASGNFQHTSFRLSDGAAAPDPLRAEAQDGSGVDNANFGTPRDGSPPRMQMFRWSPGATLDILAPPPIEGSASLGRAQFGAVTFDLTAEVVPVVDADGTDFGCTPPFQNADEIEGRIALIQRRDCEFGTKALHAEAAGAVGVIIYNCKVDAPDCNARSPEELLTMGAGSDGDAVTIPTVFAQRDTGRAMRQALPSPGVTARLHTAPVFRDADLDNGIILHEYAHGLSNRLVGGAQDVSCLQNLDQMGEGWSDHLGLMLTQRPGDTGAQRRGSGTYVKFQPTDGVGSRAAPYSTDFAHNAFTYGDTHDMGVAHRVGHVWATILWEVTWALIDAHGFDPDLYDADGTAGNQVMLQLVVEGMKLTPCSPGFVDARDAILRADTLLYDAAYAPTLWRSFARRGLGYSALQGSVAINSDNVEAFDLPPVLSAAEDGAAPAAFRLSAAAPNPFAERAALTLEVARTQPVRVGLYDALGRRVALLHDGELAGGVAHRLSVEAAGLASGTYFVRVSGEGFAATERLTLLK